ncbi:MAG TPA: HAD hydrolase-like protein [Gammaproteobacteria bacterium]|nr:HAD hydrolase-like protein [Gammaproteobacteria bacterium]
MHLLFDLDGTLTDPQLGMVACFRYALSKLNIEVAADTRLESFIGPPLRDSFRSLCGDDSEVEAAVGFYRERFATIGLFENRVYDGIPRCLEQLRTSVESIHLATSKPTIYAERIIRHFDLECFFDAVYGSELDGRWDDKSELIHHIVRQEKLNTANTFMIGDRSFDVIGARNNNLRAIGVLWGYGSEAELEQAGADRICSHPAELTDHLLC